MIECCFIQPSIEEVEQGLNESLEEASVNERFSASKNVSTLATLAINGRNVSKYSPLADYDKIYKNIKLLFCSYYAGHTLFKYRKYGKKT